MAQRASTPKTMSSKLMNMKFMQRAAASEAPSPRTPAEPAAKKQRTSNGSYSATPASTPRSEAEIATVATSTEERNLREEAFAREAFDRGDSKWYLSVQQPQSPPVPSPLHIVSAGYGALDSPQTVRDRSSEDEEESARPQTAGRRSFGKFNKAVEKQQQDEGSSASDSSSASESGEGDEDESDDPTGVNALIAAERRQAGNKARTERKAKKKAERAEAARMAEERRKKEVNLNHVTSISGYGGGGTRKLPGLNNSTCHKCGEKGHLKYMCPQTDEWKRKRGLT